MGKALSIIICELINGYAAAFEGCEAVIEQSMWKSTDGKGPKHRSEKMKTSKLHIL
jgi:hypothetical protein